MANSASHVDPPGTAVAIDALKTEKGKAFAKFLRDSGSEIYAQLVSLGRVGEPAPGDVVVVDVQVERPQRVVHAILRQEKVAILFSDADDTFPEVLALRADFPRVPHTNLRDQCPPRSLCLYDQAYESVKLDWTPARFLARIRYWLQRTATGTLHGDDQPLEPLLLSANQRLILPGQYSLAELQQLPGLFHVFRYPGPEHELTLVAQLAEQTKKADFVATIFRTEPRTHGVIEYQPQNLEQVHELCANAGFDLASSLGTKIKEWIVEKPAKEIPQCKLIVILLLPKQRVEGGPVETVEAWAFLTIKTVTDIAVALGVMAKGGGATGLLLGAPPADKKQFGQIEVATLQVLHGLSAERAAAMNGADHISSRITAIGLGALGSQIFNNLIRAGFGRWTLIDPDTLLPHNCARHFLGEWAVGSNKADAMSAIANAILDFPKHGDPIATAVPADMLKPGKHTTAVETAQNAASLVLDMSASVAVSRHCAASKSKARHISAFLSPAGRCLVIAAEDSSRSIRLDWLEMLHYRAVLQEATLRNSFLGLDGNFRYGNSCRDVSALLSQDDAAIWAGVASKTIRSLFPETDSSLRIFSSNASGEVSVIKPNISPLVEIQVAGWLVRLDAWVLDRLAATRRTKLPNETGGVLLGNFDTQRKICSIIDFIESPPDSEEWPTSYIRGCVGLQEKVRDAEKQTLDQISYVGEWHSHPEGAAVSPSGYDLEAYGWLAERMSAESLPTIMLIIGDAKRICFVTTVNEQTVKVKRQVRLIKSKAIQ